jgi:hypothetical protein
VEGNYFSSATITRILGFSGAEAERQPRTSKTIIDANRFIWFSSLGNDVGRRDAENSGPKVGALILTTGPRASDRRHD